MFRYLFIVVVLVAVLGGTAGGAVAPTPDSVLLRAAIEPDGNATFTIEHRFRLDDENTTEAFEELQATIENDTTYRDRFRARMQATVADAENATGREMAVADVAVRAETRELPQQYGVVLYEFTWVGFAAVEDRRLRIDGVLGRLFLDADSRLVIEFPQGYDVTAVNPTPDARTGRQLRWNGPVEFGAHGPRLTLASTETRTGTTREIQRVDTRNALTSRPSGVATGLAVVAVALVAAAALVARTRVQEPEEATPPSELLDSDERVLRLLEANDGRIKQAAIADALDWSDARTSQVVGELRARGVVETYRVGRENVVALVDTNDI